MSVLNPHRGQATSLHFHFHNDRKLSSNTTNSSLPNQARLTICFQLPGGCLSCGKIMGKCDNCYTSTGNSLTNFFKGLRRIGLWPVITVEFGFEKPENCSQNGTKNPPHAAHFFWQKIHGVQRVTVHYQWVVSGLSESCQLVIRGYERVICGLSEGHSGLSVSYQRDISWLSVGY